MLHNLFVIVLLIAVLLIFIQPLIVLYFKWRGANFSENYLSQSLPYTTDISGFAGLPNIKIGDQLIGKAADNQETCENGFYMGHSEMTDVNCTSLCNATSNKQFEYKYITNNNIVINNQYLRKGGWCLPTNLVRCNLNISVAVKSFGRYECVSKYPNLLGGQYGNDIIGCAPIYEFRDNLRKLIYTNNVPSTLIITDIDEKMPNDASKFRYTCNVNMYKDDDNSSHSVDNGSSHSLYNSQFSSLISRPDLGNRFQLYYDSCSFFDNDGQMVDNKCKCSQTIHTKIIKPLIDNQTNDMEGICTTCTSGYGIVDEVYPQNGSKYGFSLGINCVDPSRIEYYKTKSIEMNDVLPCGTKTLSNMRDSSNSNNYGCHRALLNVTNSYTPEMLQQIYK